VAQCGTAEDAYVQTLELVPDVVVTDIALPDRDGFSLAADLRVQVRSRGIPVVAMTAYWASDVHERADRAGMTAILMKPCQPDHLIAELHRVLRTRLPRLAQQSTVGYDSSSIIVPEAKAHS
jgi:CheY-like chemotaxis protein